MPDHTPTPGGVFLSYAREDADTARRIAEALRSQGIEVWFDQSELRGGEAWDAKIRKQIRECALFMPVISAGTQARSEGYFRREWKLAVERTSDMAAGVAFVVPVVIDDTAEARAVVPDEFLRVQWTRLPGALPTPEFIGQVKRLLEGNKVAPVPGRRMGAAGKPDAGQGPAPPRAAIPGWMWGGLVAVLAVVAAGIFTLRQPELPAAPAATPDPKSRTPEPSRASAASDKSIAVLPFANMSPDKDDAFFADGIHEDILTHLANIGDLKVKSRTSVMQYRDSKLSLQQIAHELGAAYVLEGSVRRAGGQVRITGQLIDARADEHVWAKSYDRDLKDVFAIQSALATEIANTLQAVLSPQEKKLLERPLTTNAAAYDLYLKAREIFDRLGPNNLDGVLRAEPLFESAVELDPQFAAAWGRLAFVLLRHDVLRSDRTGALREKARRAIDTMERLAPDDPESLLQLVTYYANSNDVARADRYLQRAAVALPGNGRVAALLGDTVARQGRFAEALAQYRRAYALDRQSPEIRSSLRGWLVRLRRYEEAAGVEREDPRSNRSFLARLQFLTHGSTREVADWIAAHPDVDKVTLFSWAWDSGAAAEYVKICDAIKSEGGSISSNHETQRTFALMALGETVRAREAAAKYVAAEKAAGVTFSRQMAINLALLGEKQAAVEALEAYLAQARAGGLNIDLSSTPIGKAVVLAWVGEKENAVAELARLLQLPANLNVHQLRRNPYFKPLQGEPAFEALLNDPKNNQPLF